MTGAREGETSMRRRITWIILAAGALLAALAVPAPAVAAEPSPAPAGTDAWTPPPDERRPPPQPERHDADDQSIPWGDLAQWAAIVVLAGAVLAFPLRLRWHLPSALGAVCPRRALVVPEQREPDEAPLSGLTEDAIRAGRRISRRLHRDDP